MSLDLFSPTNQMVNDVQFRFVKINGGNIGVMVLDKAQSEHPVYFLSISPVGISQLIELSGLQDGDALNFPGSNWADYQAFITTGEEPPH